MLDGFQRRGLSTAFLKPVGQRTIIEDGVPADEDAILMKQVFGLPEPLQQMSPVHIPRGFTQAYIEGQVVEDLPARIRTAHAAFAERDILLIEGTGHAGVGAVIGLSNAAVASMLGTPAVIVSEGGVGRPIDEIVLNAALFERQGVTVAGAIVNKVDLDAKPGLARTLERGLARHGIPLLGVLPYRPILSNPTLAMVQAGLKGQTIHAGPDLDEVIGGIAIGAMEPEHMLERIGPRSLVIVPGDRTDVIAAIVGARHDGSDRGEGALGPRPDRWLPSGPGGPGRGQGRQPVRDDRAGGHLPGRVRAPRPADQDAPGRRREDRRDQGAALGIPVHRPGPRGRGGGAARLSRASSASSRSGCRRGTAVGRADRQAALVRPRPRAAMTIPVSARPMTMSAASQAPSTEGAVRGAGAGGVGVVGFAAGSATGATGAGATAASRR